MGESSKYLLIEFGLMQIHRLLVPNSFAGSMFDNFGGGDGDPFVSYTRLPSSMYSPVKVKGV